MTPARKFQDQEYPVASERYAFKEWPANIFRDNGLIWPQPRVTAGRGGYNQQLGRLQELNFKGFNSGHEADSFACDVQCRLREKRLRGSYLEPLNAKEFWISERGKVKANITSSSFESKNYHCFSRKPNGNNILIHNKANNCIQPSTFLVLAGILQTCSEDTQMASRCSQHWTGISLTVGEGQALCRHSSWTGILPPHITSCAILGCLKTPQA